MRIVIVSIRPLGDMSPHLSEVYYGVTIERPDYQKEYVFECFRWLSDDQPPQILFYVPSATMESRFYAEFDHLSKTADLASTLVAEFDGGRPVELPVNIDEDPENVFQFRDPSANRD